MSVTTKAYVNFYAALGTLEKFVELDEKARAIAEKQNVQLRFKVKDGPDGVLTFKDGTVSAEPFNNQKTDIVLYCPTAQKFNDVIDNKGMPIPLKGIFKLLSFMAKPDSPFKVLTDEMSSIMRNQKRLDGSDAYELSVLLSFYAMAAAIAEVGNHDKIGKISGARIPEGEISLEIQGKAYATITKKDGVLSVKREKAKNPRSFMVFTSVKTAGDLINGKVDSMTCLSKGELLMKGYIPMLDNLNKILNIVPKYLA